MDTEVLIVGAGPTGLMLANQLARRGVRPMIIDRHSGPAQQSRAMAVQARTLEIYSKLGIIDQALKLGKVGNGANMWANGRWAAPYRIYHRAAEKFRDRRCFLLGDAAHIHSPAGAQGMNTGLQDAYSLAWKLALVIKDQAHVALLDTYEQERIPVAQRLLKTTDRAFQIIVADGWFGKLFRTRILARVAAFAMTRERVRKLAFRTISQIGIRYRRSPLSQNLVELPSNAPQAGDRFPWMQLKLRANGKTEDLYQTIDDTCFNLLIIGQSAPPEALMRKDLLGTLMIPLDLENTKELQRVGITKPCFYLLRPDGHIGLVGAELNMNAIKRYLSKFGIQSHVENIGDNLILNNKCNYSASSERCPSPFIRTLREREFRTPLPQGVGQG